MRPLLDWLRWKLFDYLQWQFPPEQPPERPRHWTVPHTGPIAPRAQPVVGIRERARRRAMSGQLFTSPIRRIDLVPDDGWLINITDVDTRKVTAEETAKYKALPKFLREG